jgi:hypothetical protein
MTAQVAAGPVTSAGVVCPPLTGVVIGTADTYPAGSLLVARNTGAGAHVVTIAMNFQPDGLAVASRAVSIAAGAVEAIRIPASYGDANGRCIVSVDGTAAEVTFYCIGV